jgi:hypothetical protein
VAVVKHSLSLSSEVGDRLKEVARTIDATPSSLADLALKKLFENPVKEIAVMLARYKLDRTAPTREWWQRSFWTLLAENMGAFDPMGNPYRARDFEDYYIVLLRNNIARDDREDEPFYIHIGTRTGSAQPPNGTHLFPRETSPVQAAEQIASELKRLGVAMDYEGRVIKVRQMLAKRLGADADNPDRFGNAQFHPAMHYGPEGERGMMVWNILRLDHPKHPHTDVHFHWRSSTGKQMTEALVTAYEKLMAFPG